MNRLPLAVMVGLLLAPVVAWAEPTTRPATAPTSDTGISPAARPDKPASHDEKISVTHHSITMDGKPFAYTATAGELVMKDEANKAKADVFFVAYQQGNEKDGGAATEPASQPASQPSARPLTICFNGGPGAASVWLHLGAIGPKTVVLNDHDLPVGPPYRLANNPSTWLKYTDLVFVDPVSTGYSRPEPGQDPKQFHGVTEDLASVADFIRLYLTKYQRWGSPIYLTGESYGTTRAAGLADYLAENTGIAVNGVVLISSVLDFQALVNTGGNDLPYQLYLPSFAAVAWYHHKLPADLQAMPLQQIIDRAKAFATDQYGPALLQGAGLDPARRQTITNELSRLTGLPIDLVTRANLRIDPGVFEKEVLGGDGHQIVGRFDGRITGYDPDAITPQPSYDPSSSYYLPAYSATFNDYVRRELKYENDLPYQVAANVEPWDFGQGYNGFTYVTDNLQNALVQNPNLRVMFVSGQFDLATPMFVADETINRLVLPPEIRKNVSHVYFPSGHMVYHEPGSKVKLSEDVGGFIGEAKSMTSKGDGR